VFCISQEYGGSGNILNVPRSLATCFVNYDFT